MTFKKIPQWNTKIHLISFNKNKMNEYWHGFQRSLKNTMISADSKTGMIPVTGIQFCGHDKIV